jgi:5-hydroxyisourate hydrolase
MSPITSHVLDTALGRPAKNLRIQLEQREASGEWTPLSARVTNADGRVSDFLPEGALEARTYRLIFETGAYLSAIGQSVFFPEVTLVFTIQTPTEHHHLPLLLSPYGYSTYRGS